MPATVAVIRTGTANLASVLAGLRRSGVKPFLTEDPADVEREDLVMLPGVGTMAAAMEKLDRDGITGPLRERLNASRPTMCVCLGMQLLCAGSDESPGVRGLGVVDVTAGRFPGSVRVPQLGWNSVAAQEGCRYLRTGYAYFANSYRITEVPGGWLGAVSVHGGEFVAAIERGGVLACQFHPELSGAWGQALINRWVETAGGNLRC
jgi:imidazole glycerol phosphate synthase glutamine amidotransferase subunit